MQWCDLLLARCVAAGGDESLASLARASAWAALHSGSWRSAPVRVRRVFVAASCIEAAGLCARGEAVAALRVLDVALMVGPPASTAGEAALPQRLAAVARAAAADALPASTPALPCLLPELLEPAAAREEARLTGAPIPRLHAPTLRAFRERAFEPRTPVILTGALEHWPAFAPPQPGAADRRWCSLAYLRAAAGERTVPLEVGGHYMEDAWAQELLTLGAFIEAHVAPSAAAALGGAAAAAGGGSGGARCGAPGADAARGGNGAAPHLCGAAPAPVRYLAQHRLFDQVPALRRDIATPDYCALGEGSGEVQELAWFGPAGTVSPAHWDAPHNLLAQVVGSKRVRLHAPSANEGGGAEGGGDALCPALAPMGNTSRLPPCAFEEPHPLPPERLRDARARLLAWQAGQQGQAVSEAPPDDTWPARFPAYAAGGGGRAWEAVLRPGEVLYIPPRWWHYVRALTPSFSVSFWW